MFDEATNRLEFGAACAQLFLSKRLANPWGFVGHQLSVLAAHLFLSRNELAELTGWSTRSWGGLGARRIPKRGPQEDGTVS